jgi:hypothetical protein
MDWLSRLVGLFLPTDRERRLQQTEEPVTAPSISYSLLSIALHPHSINSLRGDGAEKDRAMVREKRIELVILDDEAFMSSPLLQHRPADRVTEKEARDEHRCR